MFRVMIAEDNVHLANHYQNFLSKDENVSIVAKTYNGEDTVKVYKEKRPDILLLDLDLPKLNGLEVINELSEFENTQKKCNIIIVSGNSYFRAKLFNAEKVYRMIEKPINEQCILDILNLFISENSKKSFPINNVRDLMIELKLKPYSNTCNILINIIKMAYYSPELVDNMNTLYYITASTYNFSDKSVRESIRSCIRTVNRFADKETLNSIFFIHKTDINGIITPKTFVNGVLAYIDRIQSDL